MYNMFRVSIIENNNLDLIFSKVNTILFSKTIFSSLVMRGNILLK